MKRIKTKIFMSMVFTVFLSLITVSGISIYLNYSSMISTMKQSMTELSVMASQRVAQELNVYKNIAFDAGSVSRLADSKGNVSDKKSIIDQRAKTHGFERGNILGVNGVSIFDGKDYSNRDYYIRSMKGETVVSEPLVSKITGELTIIISAPLWENGIPDTKVVGVVYFVPKETFLNDITGSISISKNSSAFLLNKNGKTIADPDIEKVKQGENTIEKSKSDSSLMQLAKIETKMTAGKQGFDRYEQYGEKEFLSYAPIEGTDGWSIGIIAPMSDFMESTKTASFIILVIFLLSVGIAGIISVVLSVKIGNPMTACARRMEQLAKGDLESPVPLVNGKDETAVLAGATRQLVEALRLIILDVDHILHEMSLGNLTVKTSCESSYVGSFEGIHDAMRELKVTLGNTLAEMNQTSSAVALGAEEVSQGAQALSQGATEQAGSVETLSSTMNGISEHVELNAKNAEKASTQARETQEELEAGQNQMNQMMEAMNEITLTSNEISKIIKTIEEIAFQTNILALNAAVEAARAGEAGKGFAVVADEVRNLAAKSAEASKNTTVLIGNSYQSVQRGSQIAKLTADSLIRIADSSQRTVSLIEQITSATNEQAESIAFVNQGIDQISSVVQTNSATAEESAATSEELSSQAHILKSLIDKFRL